MGGGLNHLALDVYRGKPEQRHIIPLVLKRAIHKDRAVRMEVLKVNR